MVDGWGEFDLLGGVKRGKGEGDCIPGLRMPLLVIGNRLWRQVRRAGGFIGRLVLLLLSLLSCWAPGYCSVVYGMVSGTGEL